MAFHHKGRKAINAFPTHTYTHTNCGTIRTSRPPPFRLSWRLQEAGFVEVAGLRLEASDIKVSWPRLQVGRKGPKARRFSLLRTVFCCSPHPALPVRACSCTKGEDAAPSAKAAFEGEMGFSFLPCSATRALSASATAVCEGDAWPCTES
eukprot:1157224-Pelagomonas_calceolata.AAC.8